MALFRSEPVGELNTIQNEMHRLFKPFFDKSTPTGRAGTPGRRWIPAMDLVESGGHYVLRANFPGLAHEDVTIQLEDNVLTISGERKAEHAQHQEVYDRLEHSLGGFSPLPHAPGRREPERRGSPLRSTRGRDQNPQA
jgi:HSP20 family protein